MTRPAGDQNAASGVWPPPLAALINDAALGSEIADLLQTLIDRSEMAALKDATQRISLAARLFKELLDDPMLPETLRKDIEGVRLPIYRTTLVDPSFFLTKTHAARRLLYDIMDLSSQKLANDPPDQRLLHLMRRASSLRRHLDPVRTVEAMVAAAPLSALQVEAFLLEMHEQAQTRHVNRIEQLQQEIAKDIQRY